MDEKNKFDENQEQGKNVKNKSFSGAVKNAVNGIIHVFKTERNLRIDYVLSAFILVFSLFFDFDKTEMICLILTIGFVLFAEMVNSTVEYVVDMITTKYDPRAKAAKDIAAGGVLMATGLAVIVAYFLFSGKINQASTVLLEKILTYKTHMLVVVLFVTVILTIILKGIFSKNTTNYVVAFPSARVTVSFGLATYLYLASGSLFVGVIVLVLAIIIASLKMQLDKVSFKYIFFSAVIGIVLVILLYQLNWLKPYVGGIIWKW